MDLQQIQELTKKIKNFEFPYCEVDEEHSHHLSAEMCLSRNCIGCFKPMCYHCKFENHANADIQTKQNNNLTSIDVIPKFRNLANSGVDFGSSVYVSQKQEEANKMTPNSRRLSKSSFNPNQKPNKDSVKKDKNGDPVVHMVHPIKWVLTSLNQQMEQHYKLSGNSQENDLWDQTEQDLQNVVEYSQRLIQKITELQEGAELLIERYTLLKRQSERDERIKLVGDIMNDLLEDNSKKNLQKQLKALRKYIFVEKKGKITIMGEQELLKLDKEKQEMQENIDKYVQVLQATYDEVQECLLYSHEIIKSESHGMNFFKKFNDTTSNNTSLMTSMMNQSSLMTASRLNGLGGRSPKNDVSIKNVLLKSTGINQSEYSFTSSTSRFEKKKYSNDNYY